MKRGTFHKPPSARGKKHTQKKPRQHNTGSSKWRAIRLIVLTEDCWTCKQCGGYGDQVDHMDGDPMNNARSNLQTLCHACHSTKTVKEQGGFGYG